MAVSFTGTRIGDWTYKRGTLTANFHTVETQTSDMVCSRVCFGYGNGIVHYFQFYASPAMTYAQIGNAPTAVFTGNLEAATTNTSMFASIPPAANWIDSVTKDDTTPRTITNRANLVPWFNFTNATLYQKLKELYPSYNSFAFQTSAGALGTLVPNPYSAGLNSNYNYSAGSADDGFCNNAPGVSSEIPSEIYGTTGTGYDGNPGELEGANWPSADALGAYLLLTENPPEYKIVVDMYVNGTTEPNLYIEWKGYKNNQVVTNDPVINNSALYITCFAPYDGDSISAYTVTSDNRHEINPAKKSLIPNKTYYCKIGNYDFIKTMYNTIVSDVTRAMTEANKVIHYGINKKPESLFWFFQVEQETETNGLQYTDLWQLDEPREWSSLFPDHSLHEFTDSKTDYCEIDLEVVLHSGKSNNDKGDDNNNNNGDDGDGGDGRRGGEIPDFDPYIPTGFGGDAVLTKVYAMPADTLANVGNKLWSQDYFNVLKIQNNPIENIVSVKWFPFNPTGTQETIKIGDVSFGITAHKVSRILSFDIGSYKYTGRTGRFNFIDNTPFTAIKLYLPYIGVYQIDASTMFNSTIAVKYYVDLTTGEVMAPVTIDGVPFMNPTGNIGVDIPLTATDRVQTELKTMSATIKTGAGIAGEVLTGDILGAAAGGATGALSVMGADYTQQRTGNPSSACGSFQNHAVYLTFEYPDSFDSYGYGHTKGYPCHAWKTLSAFGSGVGDSMFIQIDKRSEINIAMTSEENAELERLLTTGVYI